MSLRRYRLRDRLGFHVDLNEIPIREADEFRNRLSRKSRRRAIGCRSSRPAQNKSKRCAPRPPRSGIVSLRAPILALRVACASAALAAHDAVDQDDIALAARLVLAPRALVFPQEESEPSKQPQEQPPPESD